MAVLGTKLQPTSQPVSSNQAFAFSIDQAFYLSPLLHEINSAKSRKRNNLFMVLSIMYRLIGFRLKSQSYKTEGTNRY